MDQLIYRFLASKMGENLEIQVLSWQTARAFGVKTPKGTGRSTKDRLQNFALFTRDEALLARQSGQDLTWLQGQLYQRAMQLGRHLIDLMKPQNRQERLKILQLLYHNIGITLREESPGTFCVQTCYFSAFYTPEVCAVVSALDAGIFAGILEGGGLTFQQRITEGKKECQASFRKEKEE